MADILETIVANKRLEVAEHKRVVSSAMLAQLAERAMEDPQRQHNSLRHALTESGSSGIIAEFKRRSPSKGWIAPGASVEKVIPGYRQNQAAAVSILTDRDFFGGSLRDISSARGLLEDMPILRKDFIVDEYQLMEARIVGADAVLLIAACLSREQTAVLASLAHELELEVILEVHSLSEIEHFNDNVDVVGVNNRCLGTFHTDVANSFALAPYLPAESVHIAESGISEPATLRELRQVGFQGFLIGESFMRHTEPGEALQTYIEAS